MNTSKKLIGGAIFIGIVIVLAVGDYYIKSRRPVYRACTAEAKICPDGSAVGRGGPQCEFAACPASTTTPEIQSTQSSIPADWKTYKNEKVGVEFKYPQDFDLHHEAVGEFDSIIYLQFVAKDARFDKNRNEGQEIVFGAAEQVAAGTPQELFDKDTSFYDSSTGKQLTLKEKKKLSDNPPTFEFIYGNGEFGKISIVRKNKSGWTIWWNIVWYDSTEYRSIVEKMLSTIKFAK